MGRKELGRIELEHALSAMCRGGVGSGGQPLSDSAPASLLPTGRVRNLAEAAVDARVLSRKMNCVVGRWR